MKLIAFSLFAGVAVASSVAQAQIWAEIDSGGMNGSPDAGQSLATANVTSGSGAITTITGRLVTTGDADLYQIRITDVGSFTATVAGGSSGDTNLSLFDASGVALAFNNNDPNGGTGSRLTNMFVPSAGLYYLAISRNDSFGGFFGIPVDNLFVPIFPDTPNNVELGPSTPGTVLFDWPVAGGFQLFNYNYSISLTGAEYAVPGPMAGSVLGLAGSAMLRRRR
jgi:hypothetical protein